MEYIYPVIGVDDASLFLIYQKSLADLELWRYFLSDEHKEKSLYWRFIPGGLKILPGGDGFSFIDSGRLRVKKFIKRSPRSIDFDQPIFGVSEINWLNNEICYFSAKQKDRHVIFYGQISDGAIWQVHQSEEAECLSPKIINQQLFYIERTNGDRSTKIMRICQPPMLKDSKSDLQAELILDCSYQQVIYLQMLSDKLGFYVEHMPYINDKVDFVTFVVYKIELSDPCGCWASRQLFKFQVPKKFLFGDDRLYESILPFLPRPEKTVLYFADIKQIDGGQYKSSLFGYDLILDKNNCLLSLVSREALFAPLKWGNKLFYGRATLEMQDLCLPFTNPA